MIRVLVADDHIIVRDALCRLLERTGDIQVVATASDGEEAVGQVVLHRPNLALLAIAMPVVNGIIATKQIRKQCPETRVLIVSGYDTPEYIRGAIKAGASGYVLKDTASQDLVRAVHSVYKGKLYFSPQIADTAQLYLHSRESG